MSSFVIHQFMDAKSKKGQSFFGGNRNESRVLLKMNGVFRV